MEEAFSTEGRVPALRWVHDLGYLRCGGRRGHALAQGVQGRGLLVAMQPFR